MKNDLKCFPLTRRNQQLPSSKYWPLLRAEKVELLSGTDLDLLVTTAAVICGATMIPAVDKYLARYIEPEGKAAQSIELTFGHALVIPAFDEGEILFRTLESIPAGPRGEVLAIVVINAPANAPSAAALRSWELLRQVREVYGKELRQGQPGFHWYAYGRGALLCVDRTGPRSLPKGQGVGLARKIGCDIALALYAHGNLGSPWIHTTDADVELPIDYFERVPVALNGDAPAALLYPFWHQCEPSAALADAMHRYELFLRYYVLGLAYAGSPYAFHTLGSTLAIHALAYAKVRGFPRRSAGEDFYVLNKLAKVGPIAQLGDPPLMIRGRSSDRVPFGTGAALKQILAQASSGERYRVYAPEVFEYLKVWLAALELLAADRASKDPDEYLNAAAQDTGIDIQPLHRAMTESGWPAAVQRAASISREPSTLARHLHTWFDAFRTLKLIHRLTRHIGKIELLDAIRAAPFIEQAAAQPANLEQLRHSLMSQERQP